MLLPVITRNQYKLIGDLVNPIKLILANMLLTKL